MSNFAIDININAPALVGAIEHLCTALGKPAKADTTAQRMAEVIEKNMPSTAAPVPQPVQTTPVPPAITSMPHKSAPAQPAAPQAPVQAAPAAAPTVKTYTMDEIAKAAGDFMTPETIPQLQALLASFGVAGLPELPADKLAAFAAELRKMGAKI